MGNELSQNVNDNLIPAELTQSEHGTEIQEIAGSGGAKWLSRLSQLQATSGPVQQRLAESGEWVIQKRADSVDDNLGATFDCIVVSQRPKAMKMPEEGGAPMCFYNPKTPEFGAVRAEADKTGFDGGCSYGPEFLLYVPSAGKFCTYFMGGKTSKNAYPDLRARLGKAATFGSLFIEKGKYSWYGPVFTKCSTPLAPPDGEELTKVAQEFNHPEDSSVEFDTEKMDDKVAR